LLLFSGLGFNISERGPALAKVYSIRLPLRRTSRSNGLRLIWRVLQGFLRALQDSRERQAQRIIADYCGQSRNETAVGAARKAMKQR
jgi:hypothetical protein